LKTAARATLLPFLFMALQMKDGYIMCLKIAPKWQVVTTFLFFCVSRLYKFAKKPYFWVQISIFNF